MASIKSQFEGKIGKAPELKGEGDKAWTAFGIATEEYVGAGKGDLRDGEPTAYKTTWVNVVAFGRQAQYITERFAPGDTIVVLDSKIEIKPYEKKDRDNNVIDSNATGIRFILREISGPYRAAAKQNGNGNGNGAGQSASQNGNQARTAPAQGRQQSTSRQAASRQQAAPAQAAASQSASYGDDIPF